MPTTVNYKLAGTSPDLRTDQGRTGKTGASSRLGAHGKTGIEPSRFVYNNDGVDDYAVLANRAINPDGDLSLEFWSPNQSASAQSVIAQNFNDAGASREFHLYVTGGSTLELIWGGTVTVLLTAAQGYEPNKKFFVNFVGNSFSVAKNEASNIIRTSTFTRGAVREPTALTSIGARCGGSIGVYFVLYRGIQRDIKINGTLYPIADRNQTIQLPNPTGLGAELITPTVLANPAAKGSQWTLLDSGRWQYVGDGTYNALRFINDVNQPSAGYLEFEVESVTGVCTCAFNNVSANFSTAGVKRYFYTSAGASSSNLVEFNRSSGIASCIIKNISFKPLGTCNPMQLVNTSSDRWQEIIP